MPPFGVWWLAPIGIALMAACGFRRYLSWGLVCIFFSLCVYSWLISVSLWGWISLFVIIGLLWAIPFWVWHKTRNRFVCAATWVTIDWARTLLGFGWLPVAVSGTGNRIVVNIASVGGEALLGFIIVFVGFTIAKIIEEADAIKKIKLTKQFFIVVIIVALLGVGLNISLKKPSQEIWIGLVQPDVPMDPRNANDYYRELQTLQSYTNAIKNDGAEIIFWPEQATPWPVNDDKTMRGWMEDGTRFLKTPVVSGFLWHENGNYYNAAAVVSHKTGLDTNAYKKRRLVPFGEYIPLAQWNWLRSLTPIVDSFASGDEAVVLNVPIQYARTIKLWPLICYEDTFDYLAWGASQNADAMVVFLNNSWFGYGAGPQHAAHSVLRSVEQGIPVIRIGNSGLSGFILPNGEANYMSDEGDFQKAQSAVMRLPMARRDTLYSHTAPYWRVGFLLMALSGIFIWRKSKKTQQ